MKIGIGYCNEKEAASSGRKVSEKAIEMGNIENPGLMFAFCSGQLDHVEFFRGLQSVVGNKVPIIGGSAVGLITNDHLSYEGYPAGAAILQLDGIQCEVASEGELDKNERLAGEKIIEKLSTGVADKVLFMFYDSVKIPPTETTPPVMNASPPLIKGLEETLKSNIPIVGAGLVGDFDFSPTNQFCGSYVEKQSVVGALLAGDIELYSRIMHGCTPKDGIYHTITRVEGPIIYEVDGKPIVEMIDNIYASPDWRKQTPVKRLTIGVNIGDKYADFKEDEYINRLIAGVLPDDNGIVIFEPDLEEGTEIQFMLRDTNKMIESAKRNAIGLIEQIKADGRKPGFGLYIDCAGRTAAFSDTLTEEAAEVQQVFNKYNIPLLGFYSGVEIAPLLGKSRGLDWTGVLLVLTES
ncbi:MAG: hypothetical protein HN366_08825 [Deltaproteobacteria bacterium]|jgi:hypothetical protein|nr:hypothetical protein [Deltaproteobacteria bacterium]